eukprot:920233-Rhodomonas_salina.1
MPQTQSSQANSVVSSAPSRPGSEKGVQITEEEIARLQLTIQEMEARHARELDGMRREKQESAHRAFCAFTQASPIDSCDFFSEDGGDAVLVNILTL